MRDPRVEVRSKVWLEVSGDPVFGHGRRSLLEAIERHGSINRAAGQINISYRRAWGYIRAMEERLGITLVERRTGGRNGGGTTLTAEAREFLGHFARLEEGIKQAVDAKFDEIFHNPRGHGAPADK